MVAHLIKVANPAGASELSSLIESQWLRSQCSQCEVDGVAFCGQLVPAHHGCACLVVNIYVCTCHTQTVHQRTSGQQAQRSLSRGAGQGHTPTAQANSETHSMSRISHFSVSRPDISQFANCPQRVRKYQNPPTPSGLPAGGHRACRNSGWAKSLLRAFM